MCSATIGGRSRGRSSRYTAISEPARNSFTTSTSAGMAARLSRPRRQERRRVTRSIYFPFPSTTVTPGSTELPSPSPRAAARRPRSSGHPALAKTRRYRARICACVSIPRSTSRTTSASYRRSTSSITLSSARRRTRMRCSPRRPRTARPTASRSTRRATSRPRPTGMRPSAFSRTRRDPPPPA